MQTNLINRLSERYNSGIYRLSFFAAIGIVMLLLVFRSLLIFTYNPEIGGIDNNFVYTVIRSIAGYDIYPDPVKFPYAVNPYSPLYFNLCSDIGSAIQVDIENPINVYRLCRSVSLLCDVLTCAVFFQIISKTIPARKEITLFITSILACLLCYIGYTFSRADSLFLLFYSSVFYVLLTNPVKNSILRNILLAVLTTACIFSKQNGIILPVLVSSWLFLNTSSRNSIAYLFLFFLFFAAAFFYYDYLSGYSHFTSHTIDAIKNKIDFSWFYAAIFKRFAETIIVLPLYIAGGISIVYLAKGPRKERTLGIIFLFQALFSLGTSLKIGSTANYFNESFFLGLIVIAHYIYDNDARLQFSYSKRILSWMLPLYLLFSSFVLVQGYLFFIQKQEMKKEVYSNQLAIKNYLVPKLEGAYVLNLGNQNGDFFKTLFYRNLAVPNHDAVDCCTFPDKTFDYSNLLSDLRSGKIGWIIMLENYIINEQWGITLNQFRKDTSINGYVIYKFQQQ